MEDNKKILITGLKPVLNEIHKIFQHRPAALVALSEALQNLGKAIAEFAKKLPSSLTTLANFGWYISWDTAPGSIVYYAEELKKGNHDIVDNKLISDIDKEIDRIEKTLVNNFPHRKNVISAAIKAHKDGLYYLSIPVFFAQTEGICNEITKVRFFAIIKGHPKTSNWVSNFNTDSFTGVLLEPLNKIDIVRQKQTQGSPFGLNRHDVLHGDSFDYGENKANSYKILSLLLYVGEIVFDSNKKIP